jgi:hypothetical protein
MSDVPELDRLLDEHETYRRNMAWNRQEAVFVLAMRLGVTVLLTVVIMGIVGISGAIAAPIVWDFTEMAMPKPQKRDPFKRYRPM